jgi:hypothetical protein
MMTRFAVATTAAVLLGWGSAYAQVGGMSIAPTQPAQEPPPATAPRQEQPTSKLKQIAMTLWRWLRPR